MELGFVADHGDGVQVYCCTWVEGSPERNFWTGTKIHDKRQHGITTYRCTGCGFLEAYASSQGAPKP